jgi:UDP-N-acetylmuramyl tripeptide synthase
VSPAQAAIRPRLTAAILAARAAAGLTRALRLGGGTVIPGHVAARLYPAVLAELARQLPRGSIVVSGTNGKTTTARMLAAVAAAADIPVVHNRAGANLPSGMLAALLADAGVNGRPQGALGIFEVDEAHVPAAVAATRPRVLLLTNLFRDQLDRYGEIDLIATRWRETVQRMEVQTLTANVDDPLLAHLMIAAPGRILGFGVEDPTPGRETLTHEADRRLCPACGGPLVYSRAFFSHLGHYACSACGWQRPRPSLRVTRVEEEQSAGTRATLEYEQEVATVRIPLPGLHNVYNAAAAVAGALAIGVPFAQATAGVERVEGAFGRYQRVEVESGSLTLILVKNPVGFTQALRSLPRDATEVVIAINDLFADGTDVSWLWDVDFDVLRERQLPVTCSGLRAHDMALRLKYADHAEAEIGPDLDRVLEASLARARNGARVACFLTYTATMDVQRLLARRGLVPPFWEG